ncbi:MAG: hypothetical protein ACR2HX_22895 [Pyrinomonadaceae bacterium]
MIQHMNTKAQHYSSLVGQFCRTSDGERVQVQRVGEGMGRVLATVRRIEGPERGTLLSYVVNRLHPLGFEIPKNETDQPVKS